MSRRIINAPPAGQTPFYEFPDTGLSQGFLMLIAGNFNSDATAANRDVFLTVRDKDGNLVGTYASETTQVANFGIQYTFGGSESQYINAIGSHIAVPMKPLTILGGDTLRIDTLGIQAGDQWGTVLFSLLGAPEDIRES